jgi:mannose-6-phosphate isomerase-like protein (cupin superfamily)
MVVSIENAEHYRWGEVSDGWHLLKREEVSVIQERVPAGGAEVMHYHTSARQFFYIIQGEGTMVFDDHQVALHPGDGLEIPPRTRHQFRNLSEADVHFLVISVPPTQGDRVNV